MNGSGKPALFLPPFPTSMLETESSRVAIVPGATGLVGRNLVRVLLDGDAYGRIVALARRDVERLGPRHQPTLVDYDRLVDTPLPMEGADVFCALGTTIRDAGSREAFHRVDFTYVVRLAAVAANGGARSFSLVSAVSANPQSRVFYSRVKGEAERAVAASGVPIVHLFRPSLLLGERDTVRPGESVAAALLNPLTPILRGPLANLRPIFGETVARAMVAAALADDAPGVRVYGPDAMRRLARTE